MDVCSTTEKKIPLKVKSWYSIFDVKRILQPLTRVPVGQQRLFFLGRELKNRHSLQECGIYEDGAVLIFRTKVVGTENQPVLQIHGSVTCPEKLMKILDHVKRGLDLGFVPQLAMEGTGGTYFMRSEAKRIVACFKPMDEEPFAINNPKSLIGTLGADVQMRNGIKAGEGYIREVAAFLFDRDNFFGVPQTTIVEALHSSFSYGNSRPFLKIGSFQEFVHFDYQACDLSYSKFSVKEVQKVALLDICLLNCDRNDTNLLVRKKKQTNFDKANKYHDNNSTEYELVPIDHSYCLSEVLEIGWCDLCWITWPQVSRPLDPEILNFVMNLNIEEEAKMLENQCCFSQKVLTHFKIVCTLLKRGVEAGLTLFTIANVIVRQELDEPSELENIEKRAKEIAVAMLINSSLSQFNHHTTDLKYKNGLYFNTNQLTDIHKDFASESTKQYKSSNLTKSIDIPSKKISEEEIFYDWNDFGNPTDENVKLGLRNKISNFPQIHNNDSISSSPLGFWSQPLTETVEKANANYNLEVNWDHEISTSSRSSLHSLEDQNNNFVFSPSRINRSNTFCYTQSFDNEHSENFNDANDNNNFNGNDDEYQLNFVDLSQPDTEINSTQKVNHKRKENLILSPQKNPHSLLKPKMIRNHSFNGILTSPEIIPETKTEKVQLRNVLKYSKHNKLLLQDSNQLNYYFFLFAEQLIQHTVKIKKKQQDDELI